MPAAVRTRLPALCAAALALEFWTELAVRVPVGTPHRALAALLLGAMAIALAYGWRAPLAGVVIVFGAVALLPALTSVYYNELLLPFVSPFLAAFWLGRYAGRRELFAGVLIGAPLGLAASVPYDDGAWTAGLFTLAVSLGAPVLIGRLLRGHAALHGALREKAALLERRREEAAGRAVIDERTRIAGELHDVVAHALSAMTVQATGARRLALTRPELARAAFAAIESSGREALDELRRLLGVLRRDDAELTLAPQPSLRHVTSLVRRASAGGLPATLDVEGAERELATGVDVTAYRVVQEALAAASDVGGAGRADVRLRYGATTLEVEVRDDGAASTARELSAIRERVVLHGGRLAAGRGRSGDHVVRATLPLDGQPMPAGDPAGEPPAEVVRPGALPGSNASRRLDTSPRPDAPPPGALPRSNASRRLDTSPRPELPPPGALPRSNASSHTVTSPRSAVSPRPSAGRRLVARLRRAEVFDPIVATVLAVGGLFEVAVSPDRSGPLVANLLVALAYSVPLAWRRRAPLAVAATVIAATLLMGLTLTSVEYLFVPFAAVLCCAYACGAHRDGRQSTAGLVLVVVALPLIMATMGDRSPADYVFPPVLGAVTWLAGRAVRARTRLAAELHEAAAQLAEASDEEQRQAAVDERRRIAREMHDLVAHSMSVMVVQAGGARRILDRDPARALEAATRIERTGRDALGEMRHLLGVLHGADAPAALAPQPTLAEIGELVTRARAAGLPAVLEVRGQRRDLPAGLDLAAYRIVQEGLTNALKHAGRAPTTVTVDWSADTLTLEVRDHGAPAVRTESPGHGLVGMRERVRLYGGELEAGAADGGGWRVRAALPLSVRELSPV